MEENKNPNELISDLLIKKEENEKKTKLEIYLELEQEKEEKSKYSSELLFQNIHLGEERGKYESLIKVYQSKIEALKAAETYVEQLTEQNSNRINRIESELKSLREEEEVRVYIEKNQK